MRETTVRPFDLRGFVLTGVGLASSISRFETIGRGELPILVTFGAAGARGGCACALYVRHARRVDHPIIDLALMRIPTYAMTTIRRRFCSAWGWARCRS